MRIRSAVVTVSAAVLLAHSIIEGGNVPFDNVYTVSIPSDSTVAYRSATWTAWVPPNSKTVRGLIVHQHGCSRGAEDHGTTIVYDEHWRSLARKHDCVLIGSSLHGKTGCGDWNDPSRGTGKAFITAIEEFSDKSSHPEIAKVPWVLWGHSGGGRWCKAMAIAHRDRMLALYLRSSAGSPGPTDTLLKSIPLVINPGFREIGHPRFGRLWNGAVDMHNTAREIGALWTWAPDPKSSHDCRFCRFLAIPYIDDCLSQRLPVGPGAGAMRSMDPEIAWVGNTETHDIGPAKRYEGDPRKVTWLPSEHVARVWKEYVTTAWVRDTTPPPHKPTALAATVVTGSTVMLTWEADADPESGIKTFRLYRNGSPIDECIWDVDDNGKVVVEFQRPSYHDALTIPVYPMRYFDRNLEPGKTYTYRASTINFSDLESERSDTAEVTVPPTVKQFSAMVPAPK